MTIDDIIMGKNKIEAWNDFKSLFLKQMAKLDMIKDERKKKNMEIKLRKRLAKFFKGLRKLGVEVHLDKKDGGQQIMNIKDFEHIDLMNIYKKYVIKTLKEVDKEVNRRIKNGEE